MLLCMPVCAYVCVLAEIVKPTHNLFALSFSFSRTYVDARAPLASLMARRCRMSQLQRRMARTVMSANYNNNAMGSQQCCLICAILKRSTSPTANITRNAREIKKKAMQKTRFMWAHIFTNKHQYYNMLHIIRVLIQ